MTTLITDFFHQLFGDNVVLATIFIAIIPLIELKGAIPFGMSMAFWQERALTAWQALWCAWLGSVIVVPLVALFFRPLYNWLRQKKFFNKIVDFLVGDVAQRSQVVNATAEREATTKRQQLWWKVLVVLLFVAFPVPLTGVWTGTCFAVLLGLNFWMTCGTVLIGNALCGLIVAFVCAVLPQATTVLLYLFIALILVAVLTKLVLYLIKKRQVDSAC